MSDPTLKLLGQMQGQIEALSASETSVNGWNAFSPPWVYASATTFTIAGADYTALFPQGTKIRLTQSGTVKYFYAVAASFGGGNTTITVTGGIDYSLANVAISNQFVSYASPAPGFPQWFNWTPGYTGFSANPTVAKAIFQLIGEGCQIHLRHSAAGTSNATSFTITGLPISVQSGLTPNFHAAFAVDNSAALTGPARVSPSGTTITMFKDAASGAWTNAGSKYADLDFTYPI